MKHSVALKILRAADSFALLEFERKNQSYFEKFVPPRPEGFLTEQGMDRAINALEQEMAAGEGIYFLLWQQGEIVGRFNFSKCGEGCFELGYRVGQSQIGKGVGTSGLMLALEHVKSIGNVGTVVAQTMPENRASIRVLEKCSFVQHGIQNGAGVLHEKKVDLVEFELVLGGECKV